MLTVDSHHHFWHYNQANYGWINDDMANLRRDFLPENLQVEIAKAKIDQVISVQARQSLAETDWLLDLANQHDYIAGVIGWLPLAAPELPALLETYRRHPKLKALRHVIQDEADDHFILGKAFNAGVDRLRDCGFTYDILVYERHLPQVIAFVDRHPDQRFVLDHLAKPKIKAGEVEPWAKYLRQLAERPQVWCKLSGMVTEADLQHWTGDLLNVYFEIALAAFGPERLLFGSDWPVCTAAVAYGDWVDLVKGWINPLSADEKNNIMGGNARKAYQLK